MSKRQSDARDVEERLLRTRALLVAQKSQKTSVTTVRNSLPQIKPTVSNIGYPVTGETFLAEVKPTGRNPGQDKQDRGINSSQSCSKTLNENGEKIREMSRILDESMPNEKEVKA